jgi:hypothetical protein
VTDSTPSVDARTVAKSTAEIFSLLLDSANKLIKRGKISEGDWLKACGLLQERYKTTPLSPLPDGDLRVSPDDSYEKAYLVLFRCYSSVSLMSFSTPTGHEPFEFKIHSFVMERYGRIKSLQISSEGKTYEKTLKEFRIWLGFQLARHCIIQIDLDESTTPFMDFDTTRHMVASMQLSSAQYIAAKEEDWSHFGYMDHINLSKDCVCDDGCECKLHPDRRIILKDKEFWRKCVERVIDYLLTLAPGLRAPFHLWEHY